MPSTTEITAKQLARLIGTPEAPVLVDVCIDEDFNADPRLVPTAFRHPFTDISGLAPLLAGKNVVVICQKGLKLSRGAAAMLRTMGVAAESLEGGNFAWRDAGLPLVPAGGLPDRTANGFTLWVTRERPLVGRMACCWLIRRFVDPGARFMFVAPASVEDVADRFGATPFDFEGVFWSHRGEQCTFDIMIEEFALSTEPLERLATIVRGAETNRHDLAPECAGLHVLSLGLSRQYGDDLAQLEAGLALYDTMYCWCRDAADEGHDWPSARTGSA